MNSILIIGGGSIGKRHLRNLLLLDERNISVVEINPTRAQELRKEFDITIFASVRESLRNGKNFNIVFICTPSVFHFKDAVFFAQQGSDLFIEKPLSHNFVGVDKLLEIATKKKIVTMVGSNWKFYPLFQKMKELIDNGAIGRVLSARCQCGQYLPDWHPWEDYRQGYSANKKLGGGILLDSHEFDYLTWFVGGVKKIFCFTKKVSNLEIDVEDIAEVVLEFESGAMGQIHLDYLQRFPQRNFEFFGEEGSLFWDIQSRSVVVNNKISGKKEFTIAKKYDINQMYIEEVKYFLSHVRQRQQTMSSINRGAEVLRLICAAKESSKNNVTIVIKKYARKK